MGTAERTYHLRRSLLARSPWRKSRHSAASRVPSRGGTSAWVAAGLPTEDGESLLASRRIDRYRRTLRRYDNPRERCRATGLGVGLVEQLVATELTASFVILSHYPRNRRVIDRRRAGCGNDPEVRSQRRPENAKARSAGLFSTRIWRRREIRTHGRVSP